MNEDSTDERPTKRIKSNFSHAKMCELSSTNREEFSCSHFINCIKKITNTTYDDSKLENLSTKDYKIMLSEIKTWPSFYNSLKSLSLKEVIELEQTIQDKLFSISQAHFNLIDERSALKNELSDIIEKEAISKYCFILLSEKLNSIVSKKREILKSTINDFNHRCISTEVSHSNKNCTFDQDSIPILFPEDDTLTRHEIEYKSSSATNLSLMPLSKKEPNGDKKVRSIQNCDGNYCKLNTTGIPLFVGEYVSYCQGKSILAMKTFNNSLFVASANSICYRFDISSGDLICQYSGHKNSVTCLEISLNKHSHQKRLYTGSSDKTVRCYDIITANCLCIFTFETQIMCLSIRSNNLFVGLSSGVMPCVNILNNKLLCRASHHKPKAISFIFSTKKYLYTGSFDATIGIFDIDSFNDNSNSGSCVLIKQIKHHTGAILCMQLRGNTLYSGSVDRTVIAFDISQGKISNKFLQHTLPVSSLQVFSSVLITACLDKKVRIFNLESSELLQTYIGYSHQLFSMVLKNNIIYTGCKNGKIFALEINLGFSFNCLWVECEQRFDNLDQQRTHLLEDHINILIKHNQTKCGWNFCQELLCGKSIKDKRVHILSHLQKCVKYS